MGERFFACVAQLAEHTTLNRTVEGSIPSARIGMGEPIRFIWPRSLVDYDGGLSSRRCSVQFRPGSYAPYREERLQSAKLHEDGSIPTGVTFADSYNGSTADSESVGIGSIPLSAACFILGCRQAVTAQDFDSCIRRFESDQPSFRTIAKWIRHTATDRAFRVRIPVVRFLEK